MLRKLVSASVSTLFSKHPTTVTNTMTVKPETHIRKIGTDLYSSLYANLYDSWKNANIPEFDYYFPFSALEIYTPAIVNCPTVRFVRFDFKRPNHMKALNEEPRIFVSDSLYRSYLNLSPEVYKLKATNYGDLESRLQAAPFYGMGACRNLEMSQQYRNTNSLDNGIFIFIDHVNTASHVKLDLNTLYTIANPNQQNKFASEHEVLMMYRESDTGKLIRNPKDKKMDYIPYVSAIVNSDNYQEMIEGKKVYNFFKSWQKFDYRRWAEEQTAKASAHQKTVTLHK